jgi:myo-inositol-1(or 4)-monophosphatase
MNVENRGGTPPEGNRLQNFLDVATEAACAGGAVLKSYWGKLKEIEEKRPGDLVTIADKEAEVAVLDVLKRHLPDHGILAEESGVLGNSESHYLWAVDPLDGTTNFTHQYPFSSVSVGLLIDGIPAVGAIYDPFHDELFRAATGLGATCDRRPIHVSKTTELSRSLLVSGFAYDRTRTDDNNYAEFCHFTHLTHGVRRGGSAALDLAYVACGRLDGYWERGLSIWDIAAGIVLVREAGGIVTAYDGSELVLKSGRILATNSQIHAEMIAELGIVKPLQDKFPMGR